MILPTKMERWADALLCLFRAKDRHKNVENNLILSRIAYARARFKQARFYAERSIKLDLDNASANTLWNRREGSGLRFWDSQSVEEPLCSSSPMEQVFNLQSAMLMTLPLSLLLIPPPLTQ